MVSKSTKYATIDEYIEAQTEEDQSVLLKFRELIHTLAPSTVETISYQIPTFKLQGNLVHFAVFKNHFGFYPSSSGIANFLPELSVYKTTKGTVQFLKTKSIPWDLVVKIVKFRIIENLVAKKK